MVKPKTFISDEQWQQKQHQLLLELAGRPTEAKRLVEKMDADPELRQGLWDIYFLAMETIKQADDQS
jgi:hypothetical protein